MQYKMQYECPLPTPSPPQMGPAKCEPPNPHFHILPFLQKCIQTINARQHYTF